MKTLTTYFNDKVLIESLFEASSNMDLDAEMIDEGNFFGKIKSFLKGADEKRKKTMAKTANAAVKAGLGGKFAKFLDAYFNDDKGKTIESDDAKEVVKKLDDDSTNNAANDAGFDDDLSKMQAKVATIMMLANNHPDDEKYKKICADYIQELKEKAKGKLDKFIEEFAKQLKNEGGEKKEGEGEEVSQEEVKANQKQVEKTTSALGGDDNKVKKALKDIIPLDKSTATDKSSLDDDTNPLNESESDENSTKKKTPLGEFKAKFLYKSGFKKNTEQLEKNKQAVTQIAGAISAALEHMVDKDGAKMDQSTLFEFIGELLKEANFKKYMK